MAATATLAHAGVKTRHKDYDKYARKWKRVRDVVAGQDEIHVGGEAYLDKLQDELPSEYLKRVRRTPFYNATWRTMAAFVGMLFRKPPTLEVPKSLEKLLEDVTMSGVSFTDFAKDTALEDISISRVGVLVDYPQAVNRADGKPLNRAEAEALNLRPSMVLYKAETIINHEKVFINNRTVLGQVRLEEIRVEKESEFVSKEIKVVRVLDLFEGKYRVRIFSDETGEQIGWDIFPLRDGKPLDHIPFYFIGPDGETDEYSDPILIDLVDMNIKHYQVSADYEHGCHMTGLPTPVITGAETQYDAKGNVVPQSYYIGSTSAWLLPQGADAKFLEFTGQGLQALENNLKGKKEEMASIGARMLTPEKAGVEAEGTLALRNAGEHSILAAVALSVSGGLTGALKDFAAWAGENPDNIKFEINRDFMPFALSPQMLATLLSAVQAGKLSHEAFFDLLKRGDLVEADLKFEIEQARIDANPPMPDPIAPLGNANDNPDDQQDPAKDKPGAKPGE